MFTCRCGATTFDNEAEARAFNLTRIPSATGSSPNRCPQCGTSVEDHAFNGDESTDFRCYDCDGRFHSHGGPR